MMYVCMYVTYKCNEYVCMYVTYKCNDVCMYVWHINVMTYVCMYVTYKCNDVCMYVCMWHVNVMTRFMDVVSSFRYVGVVVFQLVGYCCLGYRQPQCTTLSQHMSVPSLTELTWLGRRAWSKEADNSCIYTYKQLHTVTLGVFLQGHM